MKRYEGYIHAVFTLEDYEKVDNIFLDLFRQGFEIRHVKDEPNENAAEESIAGCRVVMLMITANAMTSEEVMRELDLADRHEKQIIPFVVEDPEQYEVPDRVWMLSDGISRIDGYRYTENKEMIGNACREIGKYFPESEEKGKTWKIAAAGILLFFLAGMLILGKRAYDAQGREKMLERLRNSTVLIYATDEAYYASSCGSGFFINDHGVLVTNFHVIEDAPKIMVRMTGKETYYEAKILKASVEEDLAVLSIDCKNTPYLKLSAAFPRVGDEVYAGGYPGGIDLIISNGIVSNSHHVSEGLTYISVTAATSHGSSGGPLINKKGELIGVITAKYAETENLNLARPVSSLRELLQSVAGE